MITEDELRISNVSYTNKDFASIYPELLDLAKSISPRWDPTQTNESDPGLVLLKLLAFIGDKTNYNSDKNVLECFMPSATQDKSMRALCEMNGYFPKYYQSARTRVSFRYDGALADGDSIKLPAFTTVVSDEDGEVSYSLLEPLIISESRKAFSAEAIQGTFETLTIGDSSLVRLTDLDDNNRVYLPEAMIAQNGVFVFDSEDIANNYLQSWERTDNLNLIAPSDESQAGEGKFFRVGYDSDRGMPYVEFPDSIAGLIGSGLVVKYCKTAGASGNVSAGALSTLTSTDATATAKGVALNLLGDASSESGDSAGTGTLVIKNMGSTLNGADPEGIDESYEGYKKTVGTFDTLVTCRDYANAIYNMVDDETGLAMVSNVAVADRRTDINRGGTFVTFSDAGKTHSYINGGITPYDLCMYPLKPMGESYTAENYASSFKPLSDNDMASVESALEDSKSISHDYFDNAAKDIYAIKNYYGISAVVTTSSKVNAFEQAEIKDAVAKALMKAFNGREVDYGYEIPFDSILGVIEGADSRIKNVSLEEPTVTTKVLRKDGTEESMMALDGGKIRGNYLAMLARNILAGRVPLFDYDSDFDYAYGMSNIDSDTPYKTKYVYEIDTETKINKADASGNGYGADTGYELRANEVVQLIAPNLSSKITYPAYTNFRFEKGTGQATGHTVLVPANTEHVMDVDETLYINYTDSNSTVHNIIFTHSGITDNGVADSSLPEGSEVIIRPNFDIYSIVGDYATDGRSHIEKTVGGQTLDFYTLTTNETIEDRRRVRRAIDDQSLACYWSTSSAGNALFTDDNYVDDADGKRYERLLGDNEYFAYTDSSKTELVILQSGTKLIYESESLSGEDWTCDKALFSDITKNGMSIFEDFEWRYKNFGAKNLIVEDMQILTLVEGDKIRVKMRDGASGDAISGNVIGKGWKKVSTDAEISYGGDLSSTLPQPSIPTLQWQIRSRLDLNCGPSKTQSILSGQTITVRYATAYDGGEKTRQDMDEIIKNGPASFDIIGDDPTEGSCPKCLRTGIAYSGVAGGTVDTIVSNISSEGTSYTLDLSALAFGYSAPTYEKDSGASITMSWANGYCVVPASSLKYPANGAYSIVLRMLSDGTKQRLMMLYASGLEGSGYGISVTASQDCLRLYNSGAEKTSSLTLSEGINVVELTDSEGSKELSVTLSFSKAADARGAVSLTVGEVSVIEGLNPAFKLADGEGDALLKELSDAVKSGFYYNLPVDAASQIEGDDMTKPSALWDRNNVYNRMTIGEIDFGRDSFNVSVAKSSRSGS